MPQPHSSTTSPTPVRRAPRRGTLRWLACLLLALLPATAAAQTSAGRSEVTLGGRLLAPDGGPAAGVEVRLVAETGAYARALTLHEEVDEPPAGVDTDLTDADGRWMLSSTPGRYRVLTLSSSWRPEGDDGPTFPDATRRFLTLVETDYLPDLELRPGTEHRITVTLDGQPVSGALVYGAPRSWKTDGVSGASSWGRTGEDGVVRLSAFVGEKLHVGVVTPDGIPQEAENVGGDYNFELRPGVARKVRVEDAAGRPVAGALLVYGVASLPVARTDAAGEAMLRTHDTGLSVVALGPDGRLGGGLVAAAKDGAEDERPHVLVVETPRSIRGRVIDRDTREPVAGALVWSFGADEGFAVSDGAGAYELVHATPGEAHLWADAAGYFDDRTTVPAGTDQAPTLALEPAAYVTGTVADRDGRPVAGAHIASDVQAQPGAGTFRSRPSSTSSDAAGSFRLADLEPDATYELRVTAEGFAPADRAVDVGEAREPAEFVEIVLGRGVRAYGRVVDGSDLPVAGAKVSLTRQDEDNPMVRMVRSMRGLGPDAEAVTDGDGVFAFPNLAAGRYQMAAEASGFAPAKVPGIELVDGDEETDLGVVALSPGVSVHGLVVDSAGTPLAGAQITASAGQRGMVRIFSSGGSEPADATSAVDGTFTVPDQAPGEVVSLMVSLAGYQSETVQGVRAPNDEPARIVLRQSGQVAGRVTDDSGLPVKAADVSAHAERSRGSFVRRMRTAQTTTDADGRFLLEDLAPSSLQISAEADGYRPAKISVEVPEGDVADGVELVLRPGARLTGTVFGDDGLPVIGAHISIDDGDGGPGPMRFGMDGPGRTETDGDGRYVLDGLETGTLTVVASHEQLRTSRVVDVRGGGQRVDLRFQSGVLVSGRVVDAGGLPVPGASLTLQSTEDFALRVHTESEADGSFRFADVAAGSYHLTGEASGLARTRSPDPVAVAAQPVSGVELRLSPGQVLVGSLLGAEFDALADAQVVAFSRSGMLMGEVDFEGNYRIEGLAAGEWSLSASLSDGRRASEQVVIDEGIPETVQDLDFEAGEVLEGTVVSEDGPVQGLQVTVRGLDVRGGDFAETDTAGRFRFDGLEPGRYRVTAIDSRDGRSAQAETDVPGPDVDLELVDVVVTGRVLDAWDGSPLSGVEVQGRRLGDVEERSGFERLFGSNSASTDDTGRFRLQGLTPGSWEVTASKSGYATASQPVEVVGEGTSLELSLEPADGLWLTVRRSDGAAVSKISLAAFEGGSSPITGGDFVPDEEGRVFVSTVPPGSVRVLVQAPGTAPEERDVRVPDDRPTVVLSQGAQIDVAVPSLADESVRADATLTATDGRPFRTVGFGGLVRDSFRLTNRAGAGRASISGVPAGTWRVTVTAADGRSWSETVRVPGPGRVEVLLE